MGTYWDDFLKEYPWISGAKLPTILQAFWEYCKRHEDFDKTMQRAREECNKPAVSNLVCPTHGTMLYKHPNGLAYCSLCNYSISWQTCC